MITETDLQKIVATVASAAERAERQMLETVSRRLARGITGPGWATVKLAEIARLRRDLTRTLGTWQTVTTRQISGHAERIWRAEVAAAAAAPGVGSAIPLAVNRARLDRFVAEAVGALTEVRLQTLRAAEDLYRVAVAEGAAGLLLGVDTHADATRKIVRHLWSVGVPGFTDAAGRTWTLHAYASMAARTASIRAAAEGRMAGLADAGHDLVYVLDSPQECRLCRPWEGKVLSISGAQRPSVDDAIEAGLFHPNCRHSLAAYVEGATRLPTNTADPVGDKERQRTRYLERQARHWRNRERIAAAAGNSEMRRRARSKRREWSGRLREHVETAETKQRIQRT